MACNYNYVYGLAILFFIIGYLLVLSNRLEKTTYNEVATIVGGVGSVLGLLSLILPGLKTSDIKTIEIETLKNLTKAAEEIQKKEAELNIKQSDITKLELQKEQLEFLVKNASLNLFFKEQIERYYERLDRQISDNKEISTFIKEIKELEYKIRELDIQIEKNPNAESILQIIEKASDKGTQHLRRLLVLFYNYLELQ